MPNSFIVSALFRQIWLAIFARENGVVGVVRTSSASRSASCSHHHGPVLPSLFPEADEHPCARMSPLPNGTTCVFQRPFFHRCFRPFPVLVLVGSPLRFRFDLISFAWCLASVLVFLGAQGERTVPRCTSSLVARLSFVSHFVHSLADIYMKQKARDGDRKASPQQAFIPNI